MWYVVTSRSRFGPLLVARQSEPAVASLAETWPDAIYFWAENEEMV